MSSSSSSASSSSSSSSLSSSSSSLSSSSSSSSLSSSSSSSSSSEGIKTISITQKHYLEAVVRMANGAPHVDPQDDAKGLAIVIWWRGCDQSNHCPYSSDDEKHHAAGECACMTWQLLSSIRQKYGMVRSFKELHTARVQFMA
ncbi:hypothetical protein QOT17_002518 [Balamuthia mandrillaris]